MKGRKENSRQIDLARSILDRAGYEVKPSRQIKKSLYEAEEGKTDFVNSDRYITSLDKGVMRAVNAEAPSALSWREGDQIFSTKSGMSATFKGYEKNTITGRYKAVFEYDTEKGKESSKYDLTSLQRDIKNQVLVNKGKSQKIEEADVRIPREDMYNPADGKVNIGRYARQASEKERAEKERIQREERRAALLKKYSDVLGEVEASGDPLETAFNLLVPASGQADTVAGELVRAMMRLMYRDYNDGDVFYEGYGLETCASSAAYIMQEIPELVDEFEGIALRQLEEDDYTRALEGISDKVISYIFETPETLSEENTEDSRKTDIDMISEWIPTYNLDVDIPDNLQYHIDTDHISERELQWELESWDHLDGDGVEINVYPSYIEIDGLGREDYEMLSMYLRRWLENYGDDLDREYGSAEDEEGYEEDEYEED